MPGQAPLVGDERDALRVFLDYHQGSYLAVAFGLSDEQARSTPTVSALSIGGLIKHATGVQRSWMERVAAAPDLPPKDTRPFEEIVASYQDEYVMRDDETLAEVLDKFKAQNAETQRTVQLSMSFGNHGTSCGTGTGVSRSAEAKMRSVSAFWALNLSSTSASVSSSRMTYSSW